MATEDELHLTEREEAIARRAAEIAIEQVTERFYAQVGKSVVTKMFVWLGVATVGFGVAKGWIKWAP